MLIDELLVDRPHDLEIDFDRIEVKQGNAKLVGCCNSNCAGIRQILVDEVGNQRQPLLLCGIASLQEALLGDNPILNEPPGQPCKIIL